MNILQTNHDFKILQTVRFNQILILKYYFWMHFPQANLTCSFSFSFPCGFNCQKFSPDSDRDISIKRKRKLFTSKDCFSKHNKNGLKKSMKQSIPSSQMLTSYGLEPSQTFSKKNQQSRIIIRSSQKKSLKGNQQKKKELKEKYSLKILGKFQQEIQKIVFPAEPKREKNLSCKQSTPKEKFNIVNQYTLNIPTSQTIKGILQDIKQNQRYSKHQKISSKQDSQKPVNHFASFNPIYQTPYIGKRQLQQMSMKSSLDNQKNLKQTVKNPQSPNYFKMNYKQLTDRNLNLKKTVHNQKYQNPLEINLSSVRGKENKQQKTLFHIQNIFDLNDNSMSNIQVMSPCEPISNGVIKTYSGYHINGAPSSSTIFQNHQYLSSSISYSVNTTKKSYQDYSKYKNQCQNPQFDQKSQFGNKSIQGSQDSHVKVLIPKHNKQISMFNGQYKTIETFVNKKVSSIFDSFQAQNNEISLVVGRGFTQKSRDLISERSGQEFESPQKKPRIIRLFSGIAQM